MAGTYDARSRAADAHRSDTSRQCCDGRCNDNQGRGGCPRVPESMPKPAPQIPRVRFVPERQCNPLIARAVCWLVWLLIVMGAISLAALQVPL
jgi:hypothetical protein